MKAEFPWLLSGASLEAYKSRETRKAFKKRVEKDPGAVQHKRRDIKETAAGVKITDLPEQIKGERTELISELRSAMSKLEKPSELEDFRGLAEHSETLRKALESGDIKTGMLRGMRIGKELEKSARQIKKENLREIRRAKEAG